MSKDVTPPLKTSHVIRLTFLSKVLTRLQRYLCTKTIPQGNRGVNIRTDNIIIQQLC